MENVVITAHLGGFNDTYVRKALPRFETNPRLYIDGRSDDMIDVVET